MKKVFISLALAVSACTHTEPPPRTIEVNGHKLELNIESVPVDELQWRFMGLTDYPFTTAGHIYCFNNAVNFAPYPMKETDVQQPLNQRAVEQLRLSNLTPTANSIKPNADLTQAINIGLKVCDYNNKEFDRTH